MLQVVAAAWAASVASPWVSAATAVFLVAQVAAIVGVASAAGVAAVAGVADLSAVATPAASRRAAGRGAGWPGETVAPGRSRSPARLAPGSGHVWQEIKLPAGHGRP